jgi:membrane-associated phospholipid phosphatase
VPRTARSAALVAGGFVAALPVVAVLAYYVRPVRLVDAHVLDWFASHGHPGYYEYTTAGHVAKAVIFFAEPVPMLVIVFLACASAIYRRRSADALAAILMVAGANLTTQVLKQVFAHQRFEAFLSHRPDLATFPSGHVTGAASMVVALIWVSSSSRRRLTASLGTAYIVMAGISVLLLDWHFPSDVIGALCVTGIWTFAVLSGYLYRSERVPRLHRVDLSAEKT